MIKLRWIIETFFLIIATIPISLLPYKISIKTGEKLGLLLFYIWRKRRNIAIQNISKLKHRIDCSSPEILAKKTFINLGISFVEIIKLYYGFGQQIINNIEIKGIDNYHKAKSKNKGILFITGHCGNWELMAIAFSAKVASIASVARVQNNPYINKLLEMARTKYGNKVIYKKGALRSLLFELRNNRAVGILMDQSVFRSEGFSIDFLGIPALTTKMPALIARKTGAAVLPVFINRNGNKHIIKIHPEVILSNDKDPEMAIIEDTKIFSSYIEQFIKEHPSEWLWIHRRWKSR